MQREQIQELLKRRPFQPFRVHLTDGRACDVSYPGITLLSQYSLTIGFPEPDDPDPDPVYDRTEMVQLSQISRVGILPAEVTPDAR
jgi:hypothetical protein